MPRLGFRRIDWFYKADIFFWQCEVGWYRYFVPEKRLTKAVVHDRFWVIRGWGCFATLESFENIVISNFFRPSFSFFAFPVNGRCVPVDVGIWVLMLMLQTNCMTKFMQYYWLPLPIGISMIGRVKVHCRLVGRSGQGISSKAWPVSSDVFVIGDAYICFSRGFNKLYIKIDVWGPELDGWLDEFYKIFFFDKKPIFSVLCWAQNLLWVPMLRACRVLSPLFWLLA